MAKAVRSSARENITLEFSSPCDRADLGLLLHNDDVLFLAAASGDVIAEAHQIARHLTLRCFVCQTHGAQ